MQPAGGSVTAPAVPRVVAVKSPVGVAASASETAFAVAAEPVVPCHCRKIQVLWLIHPRLDQSSVTSRLAAVADG